MAAGHNSEKTICTVAGHGFEKNILLPTARNIAKNRTAVNQRYNLLKATFSTQVYHALTHAYVYMRVIKICR